MGNVFSSFLQACIFKRVLLLLFEKKPFIWHWISNPTIHSGDRIDNTISQVYFQLHMFKIKSLCWFQWFMSVYIQKVNFR